MSQVDTSLVAAYTGISSAAYSAALAASSAPSSLNSGCASCRCPLNTDTRPANMPCRPGVSWRSQNCTLLKNVSASRARPSVTVTSSNWPRLARIGRVLTFSTRAKTVTSSPSRRDARSVSSPRLAYRRG